MFSLWMLSLGPNMVISSMYLAYFGHVRETAEQCRIPLWTPVGLCRDSARAETIWPRLFDGIVRDGPEALPLTLNNAFVVNITLSIPVGATADYEASQKSILATTRTITFKPVLRARNRVYIERATEPKG